MNPILQYNDRDIMLRLREETRDAHIKAETTMDITHQLQSIHLYTLLLHRLYRFYAAFEQALAAVLAAHPDVDISYANKTGWLAQDLNILQPEEIPGTLLRHLPLPKMENIPALLGCLYVVEGSMLGGQIIARQIQTSLQLNRENGARFFYGYGDETGKRWREFGNRMRVSIVPEQQDETIVAARAMFDAFILGVAEAGI